MPKSTSMHYLMLNEGLEHCSLNQVCMGFPLKYTSESATGKKLKFSPTVFCWGLTKTILQTGLMSFAIYLNTNNNNFTVYMILIMTTMLTEVVSFNRCARKYTKFLDVCDTLERFDYSVQLTPSKRWITVKFTALIAVSTVVSISSVGISLYQILYSAIDYEIFSLIIVTVCSMFAHFAQMCILVQLHEVTHCIATRFRLINARIRQEVIIQSYRQLVLCQSPRCINRGQDKNSNNKIKTLMSAYQMLRVAVDQSNGFYSDLLLSLICYKFVHLTVTLYTLFLFIESKDPLVLIETGLWTLCHICYMIQIVSSSSDVTQAADETSPIICKLINKDLDAGLKKRLELFLLQLTFQSVEFSAKGIFNINRQMLTTMAATVTTYLVILIQFQNQTTNCD
ncbi:gustatory receptor [Homalodisca vitripennis]|nr:gustatory receptor [Homalodisca vitripennis]